MSLIVKPFFSSATVFLLMIIYFGRTTAKPNYIYHFCIGGNYTSNSTFQDNLNSLLFSLTLSTRGKLEKRSVGSNPDTVYGFLQCRGDVSSAICTDCVDTATIDLVNRFCPNSREAIVWYDECMLRYSNRSFFSVMQENPGVYLSNTQNVTDPDRFNPALSYLMNDLVAIAVSSSRKNTTLFATGERKVTAFQNVYGIAQCTVDINPSSCNRCLRGAIVDLSSCCDGKQGGRVIRPSCYLRYEIYPFIRTKETDEDIHSPPLIPSPSSPTNGTAPSSNENWTGQKKSKTRIYKVVVPVAVTALAIAFGICICLIRRKAIKEKAYTENIQAPTLQLEESANDLSDSSKHNEVQADGVEVPFFDFETILAATNNFSNSNRLGQGGFGPVYKGTFRGTDLAVKRLSRSSGQGLEEFKNEVLLIAKLQHRNLVRLLGYCIKGEEKMLLYEYMPNKSLDSFIFDQTPSRLLNWEKRVNIILGTARGILYLHQDSRLRIIHRDLKTSNILLDEEMNPKISDFGMARIFGGTQTQGNTNRVVGTYGYMSPEYALDGIFSVKSDVYSFGVVILEIISGKKNTGFYNSEESLSLIGFAWKLWNEGKAVEFVDHLLREACNVGEVLKCIHVGLLCVQEDATDRPTMSSVILMLSSEAISLPTPKQPAFFFRKYNSSTSTSSDRPESCSRNEMTISAQEGR